MQSDEDLMGVVAQGDMEAFEQIVRRYQTMVYRMAIRFVGNPADAQDIAQAAFLRLYESAPRYRPTARFKTYLYRIVSTTCMDYARKKRPIAAAELPEVTDGEPMAFDALSARERETALRRAIEVLPLRQRSVIVLRYDAELTVREIALILKTTEKAVERLLARARKALETKIAENRMAAGDF